MKARETSLPGVLLLETAVHGDTRGHFMETWREQSYASAGVTGPFVQDNAAFSLRGVLRGLHYQWPRPQGKLVGVVLGEVFDVAVDLRHDSPTFGRWTGHRLSAENGQQLWIPAGCAHGYLTLSDTAVFVYKCTDYHHGPSDRAVAWDDPDIGIDWPETGPLLSVKDAAAPRLRDVPPDLLPAS